MKLRRDWTKVAGRILLGDNTGGRAGIADDDMVRMCWCLDYLPRPRPHALVVFDHVTDNNRE